MKPELHTYRVVRFFLKAALRLAEEARPYLRSDESFINLALELHETLLKTYCREDRLAEMERRLASVEEALCALADLAERSRQLLEALPAIVDRVSRLEASMQGERARSGGKRGGGLGVAAERRGGEVRLLTG